jgi:hypothetical protein
VVEATIAPVDGDVLYAVTTGRVTDERLDSVTLGVLASELAWHAILSGVGATP